MGGQPGGRAAAGREPRRGEGAQCADTRPRLRVAKLGLRESPLASLGVCQMNGNCWLRPCVEPAGQAVLDEALEVQPVACGQAALAARCPSLHPKDAISCRSYTVYNDAKKLLFW